MALKLSPLSEASTCPSSRHLNCGSLGSNVTFVIKRTWDFQGSDDENIIRDPATGAFLGRPFPAFDAVLRTYAPNYSFQQFRSLQFLYTRNFGQRWGMNAK